MIPGKSIAGRLVFALLLVACGLGPVACAGVGCDRSLTVIGNWSDGEAAAFGQVLAAFEAQTGCVANYHGSQSLDQELRSDVQASNPPDVAIVSRPSDVVYYADSGALQPFTLTGAQSDAIRRYPVPWQALESQLRPQHDAHPGALYAIVFKADLKSAVWYDPLVMAHLGAAWTGPPSTWAELGALSAAIGATGGTPWCLGMEATPNSGWPGTDWIEDILLHQSGVSAYQDWVNGTLPWSSPAVRQAWTTWRSIIMAGQPTQGGVPAALLTNVNDTGKSLFARPVGCYLDHKASFIMSDYRADTLPDGRHPAPLADYRFFPFPTFPGRPGNVSEVSADFATLFRQSSAATKLLNFLASDQAQGIWPGLPAGSAFSVDTTAGPHYSDPVKQQVAARLTRPDATLCFDGSDQMPIALSTAFNEAVLRFLIDPNRLDELLAQLDQVSRTAHDPNNPNNVGDPTFHCGH